ncbi:major histocompatibility complex class I-related gene protein-like isoform X1 [Pelmatolapia mariae]|uniref:major histocompatibility complex class I-related gene protein-like isoform X1 n=1 Tax=Pelmatolapia mariae TaxID=158779 RepID=UPI003211E868
MNIHFIAAFSLLSLVVSPVKHSLKFIFTESSGVQDFVGVLWADETELVHCNTNLNKAEPKPSWLKDFMKSNQEHNDLYTQECLHSQHFFKDTLNVLRRSCSQTEGVHTLQRMYGCEWDNETEEVKSFDRYGYDGEDLMEFNQETQTWLISTPCASIVKHKLDNQQIRIADINHYLTNVCSKWLKQYLDYGKYFLQRTDWPSVSLLQKTPSSPVSCHATGFYPDRAVMFWRKDGKRLYQFTDREQIYPNQDRTFQINVVLKLLSVTPEDWSRYDCVFQLSAVKEDIIIKLDQKVIKSNRDYLICTSPEENNDYYLEVFVGFFFVLLIIVLVFIVYKITVDESNQKKDLETLKYSPIAALVLALILCCLTGVHFYKTNTDFSVILRSDYALKWREPLPGIQWRP